MYFGFDDALTTVLPAYYVRLFNHTSKRNPNGCPIGMTLYVSHKYTQYQLVNRYYKEGHEIAVHSVTHSHIKTREDLQREADKQKKNIAKFRQFYIFGIYFIISFSNIIRKYAHQYICKLREDGYF